MSPEIAARLESFGILVIAESSTVSVFMREEPAGREGETGPCCVAMAGHTAAGGFSLGSTAVMTGNGPAYLVWREGQARLIARGSEVAAETEQVEAMRRFSEDLKAALQLSEP